MSLDFLFNPKSIAIVGVSSDPKKLGSVVVTNLKSCGYAGQIYPVNPKYQEVYGLKCYPKLTDIEGDVELVCIVVPVDFVKEVLEEAGAKGVKGAIIITAGFAETGAEGAAKEKELLEIAKKYNIRLLGPNCLGEIIPKNKINLSFAMSDALDGNVAFVSQSGAFLTAGLDLSLTKNLGFSHMISMGNKSDLNEDDFITDWLQDTNVAVIGAYLEDIEAGRELANIYETSKTQKPFIVFKPGETEQSAKAISSHTGSLAGSYAVFETTMQQNGIVIAKDINDMFNLFMAFSWSKLPKGNRIGIVTNAGGPGVIATDYLVKNNLVVAEISEASQAKMRETLPSNASLHNPVDIIGDADSARYDTAINALAQDDGVDAILVLLTPQIVTEIETTAKLIINAVSISNKPIIPVFLGGKYTSMGMQKFYDDKVACFDDISEAVETLGALTRYVKFFEEKSTKQSGQDQIMKENLALGKNKDLVSQFVADETKALPEDLVTKLCAEVLIELPKQMVVQSIEEAVSFAGTNYPVVLKATTEVIAHKTDQKALYLNINDEQTLRQNFAELSEMIKTNFGVQQPQLLIQEQIKTEEEVFVGVNRDGGNDVYAQNSPGFGHLLAFGKGGIYTEVYKDIAYSVVPSTNEEILESIKKTKIFQIIDGARGKEKLALDKLVELITKVQRLVLLYPEIESLDINPVLLTQDRAVSVDVKIFVKK